NSITTDQGLPSNTIMAIEIDNSGIICASTPKGISKIDPRDLTVHNYDVEDGLVSREFIEQSSFKDNNGWLYFGGRNGFTYFHPDSLKENKFIPPVYITSLTVAGEPKYFDKPLYELEDIELGYNENDFSFDFVALNYINPQKNQYAYMLEGYDEDWIQSENRRTAFYTNLSPGKYTFRVKGSNNDGYWNEEGAHLALFIHPPFWKTWWAYLFYAMVFIIVVYMLRRNELRKINLRQELELEHINAEKMAELDKEKSKFFSNISHEFRTPLTLILGPLDRVIERLRKEENKTDLSIVRRSALRLQTLVNQLLSLSKLESGKMKLRARQENIVRLTHLYLQSFHSMAEDREIKLAFESDAEEYMVYVDTIKFEKVVNNLLSNALKYTDKGGEINVSVSGTTPPAPPSNGSDSVKENSSVFSPPAAAGETQRGQETGGIRITFSDTGTGIPEEDLPHVFDRFYQVDEKQMKTTLGTGIGLALTKELVELHQGTSSVQSETGKGTVFTVILPSGKDHLSADEIVETGKHTPDTDDDLLNDDYLFMNEVGAETKTKSDVPGDDALPLLLIVEDNEDMRSYIKSYLEGDYNIIEAEDGEEGAEKAVEHIPDLIVSDLMMPKMDGNQMTARLKTDERTSHIPVILLTAKASRESKLEGLETGADDFLTKPFDADELVARVNNLVHQRKHLREVFGRKLSFMSSPGPDELKDSGITSMDEQFLSKAYEVAEREMSDPEFGVSAFSRQMGLSRMQLHRKLTALTDQSASEFIKIIRLNKAAVLLKSKNATAAEIAYDVGFNTPAYFSTCFKEHFGISPSEYTGL
ncbi:MAG: hybrid sensor histidine kinase/response regulator transcription factor, partial [bacterium]